MDQIWDLLDFTSAHVFAQYQVLYEIYAIMKTLEMQLI